MNGPSLLSDDDIDSVESEVTLIIERWRKVGFIDLPSGTIRDDFSVLLGGLQKTDIHTRALEEVFRACMEIRLESALEKGVIAHLPQQALWVLSGEEHVEITPGDVFFGNYIIQMRQYYDLFLEWQKSKKS